MPEHGASRAQEHVQILCGDTCTLYQILLDNARDAGSCIVTPALSLFLSFPLSLQRTIKWRCAVACGTHGVVQLQNLVTVCLARVVAKEKTHPHFAASREISVTVDAGVQDAVFTCSQLSDLSADPSLWNVRRREPEDESVAILRPLR